MTPITSHPAGTGGRLALEWARLRTRPHHLRTARRWNLVNGPVVSLDDVLVAVGYETDRTDDAERRLRRLVAIAAHDDLAARVVVQRILPGLLAVVRRRRGMSAHVLDELLATAWISIRTYNTDREPASIAAALIADADYRAFRAPRRKMSFDEQACDPTRLERTSDESTSACEQLAALLADAAAQGVSDDELQLVRDLLDTSTVIDLARRLNVTPRTIRNRRDRVTSRLREVALAA